MEVLKDQHQGPGPSGSQERLGTPLEELTGELVLDTGLRHGIFSAGDDLQRFELTLPGAVGGSELSRFDGRDQGADRLDKGLIRRTHRRHARSEQHGGSPAVQLSGGFGNDAGLTDTRFATDEDDLSSTLRHEWPGGRNRGQLPAASDEGGAHTGAPADRQRRTIPTGHRADATQQWGPGRWSELAIRSPPEPSLLVMSQTCDGSRLTVTGAGLRCRSGEKSLRDDFEGSRSSQAVSSRHPGGVASSWRAG